MRYFADTYALFEFYKGSIHYRSFFRDNEILTTRLNLMELYYIVLLNQNEEKAEELFRASQSFIVEFTDDHVREACRFRFTQRGKNISYVDALGYIVAKNNHAKFLTGDGAFKGMENVEWVK
jgi:predicted nucleic acid-binding protein